MYEYQRKNNEKRIDDLNGKQSKQTDAMMACIPLQKKAKTNPLPYFGMPRATAGNSSSVVQRYLIIGTYDVTSNYYEILRDRQKANTQKESEGQDSNLQVILLDECIEIITQQMLIAIEKNMTSNNEQDVYFIRLRDSIEQMRDQPNQGLGLVLREQLKKWILDDVGNKKTSRNVMFGQKYQPHAYRSYYDLAVALVGWVEAKEGRGEEKGVAREILEDEAIGYYLTSVLKRLNNAISCDFNSEIIGEIYGEKRIEHTSLGVELSEPIYWTIYKSYYDRRNDTDNALPNYEEVLQNPEGYSIREKIGILHDLMHYFLGKFGDGFLLRNLSEDFTATMLSGRQKYDRPKNTQIWGDREKAKKGEKPLILKEIAERGQKPNVIYSDEEQHPSYQYARRMQLPMYGRHSFSAARMMGLAKQTGAKPEEISAVAWAIMAFWRIHYDHTNIPYHTAHEIMDFTPAFGIGYNPEKRFAGLERIRGKGFLEYLKEIIKDTKANDEEKERALGALLSYDQNDFERVEYLLENHGLWDIQEVMNFLQEKLKSLSSDEFKQLSFDHLKAFFDHNDASRSILEQLDSGKEEYVQEMLASIEAQPLVS